MLATLWTLLNDHFAMVPLNLTYLHCLQHSFFENLFNLYNEVLNACNKTTIVYNILSLNISSIYISEVLNACNKTTIRN